MQRFATRSFWLPLLCHDSAWNIVFACLDREVFSRDPYVGGLGQPSDIYKCSGKGP